MAFPITVKFSKGLKVIVTDDNKQLILQYIERRILEKNADNVLIGDHNIRYKGTTKPGRHALFGGVDHGLFILEYNNAQWSLTYQITLRSTLITSIIIAVLFCTGIYFTGVDSLAILLVFVFFGCLPWCSDVVAHEDLADRISIGINKQFGDQEQILAEKQEASEELKSWF